MASTLLLLTRGLREVAAISSVCLICGRKPLDDAMNQIHRAVE